MCPACRHLVDTPQHNLGCPLKGKTARAACNCMVPFEKTPAPSEHAEDCPVRRFGVLEWRSVDPRQPHESDECWTRDREEAENEVETFHALGATGYRLDYRTVLDV